MFNCKNAKSEMLNTLPREISLKLLYKVFLNVKDNFTAMAIEDSFISWDEQSPISKFKFKARFSYYTSLRTCIFFPRPRCERDRVRVQSLGIESRNMNDRRICTNASHTNGHK